MKRFEQEVNSRLSRSLSMEGVDREALWTAIAQGQAPAHVAQKGGRRKLYGLLLGLLGVAGLTWGLLAWNANQASTYAPRLAQELELQPTAADFSSEAPHPSTSTAEGASNTATSASATSAAPSSAPSSIPPAHTPTPGNTPEGQAAPAPTSNRDGGTPPSPSTPSGAHVTLPPTPNTASIPPSATASDSDGNGGAPAVTSTPTPEFNNAWSSASGGKQGSPDASTGGVADLPPPAAEDRRQEAPAPSAGLSPMESIDPRLLPPTQLTSAAPTRKPGKFQAITSPISYRLYAGSVLLNERYTDDGNAYVSQLSGSLSREWGSALGAQLRIKHAQQWAISAGVEYTLWKDRFDQVFVADTVLGVVPDQVLGQSIRTVKHYNTATLLTLPVQLELYHDIERLRLGLFLGGSYTLVVDQSGRLLSSDNDVLDYTHDTPRYANFLSTRMAPMLGYKLTDRLMLDAQCIFGFQAHDAGGLVPFDRRSVAIMPVLGVTVNY